MTVGLPWRQKAQGPDAVTCMLNGQRPFVHFLPLTMVVNFQ